MLEQKRTGPPCLQNDVIFFSSSYSSFVAGHCDTDVYYYFVTFNNI